MHAKSTIINFVILNQHTSSHKIAANLTVCMGAAMLSKFLRVMTKPSNTSEHSQSKFTQRLNPFLPRQIFFEFLHRLR
ncbi:hypothetical protein WS57_22025 [Burkholderia pseudomultivorans]|nr:hypothetical protein WS57_22025 [Burkholderia pseudomultivorans]